MIIPNTKTRKKLKAAIIGLGHQAWEDHIPAIKDVIGVKLVAVSEIDEKKVKAFSRKNKKVKNYKDFNLLLEKEKPDFIIVALPHHLHWEVIKSAAQKKIHILKEKPFAVSLKQARQMHQIAEKNKVQIVVTLQRRFNPIYSTFFQLIDKIGRPFYIDATYCFCTDNPHGGWRGKRKLAGGGCLIDMGYHLIDILVWYFGLPDNVFAEMSCTAKERASYDAEDTARVIFRYSQKSIWGSLLVSRVIPPKRERIEIYGTGGFICLERGKIERYSASGDLEESLKREHSWPSAARDQIEYFVKVLQNIRENVSGPEFHFNHLAFIEAAYKSAEENKYINPKNFLEL